MTRERPLRMAGALAVLLLAGAVAWSWVVARDPARPWSLTVELGGTIDHYDDDTLVVSTTTRGRRRVVLTAETVVTDGDAGATVSALRPDRLVVVRGDVPGWGRPLVARNILVWR